MFGNVISNKRLVELINEGIIKFTPFNERRLDTIHYPLYADAVFKIEGRDTDGRAKTKLVHTCDSGCEVYEMRGSEFVLVRVRETIAISKNIVAQFASPFYMVEGGLDLISGRLEAPFGHEGQKLIFGIKNLTDNENYISYKDPIAYIYFIDLTGLDTMNNIITPEERRVLKNWVKKYNVAKDDGVIYE